MTYASPLCNGLFGPVFFYIFGRSVYYLVLRFSIYSVFWIRSSDPARNKVSKYQFNAQVWYKYNFTAIY